MLHLFTCHGCIMPRLAELLFLFLQENICCGYSLEVPRRGTSNEYHNICFHGEIRKILTRYPFLSWLRTCQGG